MNKSLKKIIDFYKENRTLSIAILANFAIGITLLVESEPNIFNIVIYNLILVIVNLTFYFSLKIFIFLDIKNSKKYVYQLIELALISVNNILVFTKLYTLHGIDNGESITNNVLDCLYFSIVTWTTLGYGDFSPTINARFYAAMESVFGYLTMAILTGLFLSTITSKFNKE